MTNDVQEIIEDPMGDDDIRFYFPSAPIYKYSQLKEFNSVDEILPNDKDFAFLLYEDSPNKGHWVCISKNNGEYEFFDSYGGYPDSPLGWNNHNTNKLLGQGEKTLSKLFNNTKIKVIYNPVKYQEEADDVNTCGRHCVFRIKNIKDGKNLNQYYRMMKKLKENTGKNYDEIVSSFIKKT